MKRLTKNKLGFIGKADVIRVATVSRRGVLQVTPVSHIVWHGKVYFASDYGTVKLVNLKRNPNIALVADKYSRSWRNMGGVMVQGKARIIKSGPIFKRAREELYKKHKPYRTNSPFEAGESAIVEVAPTNIFSWWYD